jgi:hypothetical protein
MNIISLDTFKQLRKDEGSWSAAYTMLIKAGIPEQSIEHFIDSVAVDLGRRQVEKLKSKHLYQILDGYLLACQEYMLSH